MTDLTDAEKATLTDDELEGLRLEAERVSIQHLLTHIDVRAGCDACDADQHAHQHYANTICALARERLARQAAEHTAITLSGQRTVLLAERAERRQRCEELMAELVDAGAVHGADGRTIAQLTRQLAEEKKEHEALRQQLADVRGAFDIRITVCERENDALRQQLAEAQAQVAALREALTVWSRCSRCSDAGEGACTSCGAAGEEECRDCSVAAILERTLLVADAYAQRIREPLEAQILCRVDLRQQLEAETAQRRQCSMLLEISTSTLMGKLEVCERERDALRQQLTEALAGREAAEAAHNEAQAQIAALREAGAALLQVIEDLDEGEESHCIDAECIHLGKALADTAATADAYTQRIRAEERERIARQLDASTHRAAALFAAALRREPGQ